jgi:hypothetical protein
MSIEIRGRAVKNRQFHVVNELGVDPAPKKIIASWFRLDLIPSSVNSEWFFFRLCIQSITSNPYCTVHKYTRGWFPISKDKG